MMLGLVVSFGIVFCMYGVILFSVSLREERTLKLFIAPLYFRNRNVQSILYLDLEVTFTSVNQLDILSRCLPMERKT